MIKIQTVCRTVLAALVLGEDSDRNKCVELKLGEGVMTNCGLYIISWLIFNFLNLSFMFVYTVLLKTS